MITKISKTSFWQQAGVMAAGFGLGGALWGLEAYRGTVGSDDVFTNPFSYILGAVALAVFGGLALAYLTQVDGSPFWSGRFLLFKHTSKIVGIGLVGWIVAFFLPAVWVEWWLALGGILVMGVVSLGGIFSIDLVPSIMLEPSLSIGHLWFEFLVAGAIIGLVYSLILKSKILRTVLWSAGGFALASLIGPILGNLIGNLFHSMLLSYLFTFLIIGVVFGLSLSLRINKKEKEGSTTA